MEPSDVEHLECDTGVYALVNKSPKKKSKDKEVASLLSSTVRAQLPPEANEQIEKWEPQEEKKPGKNSGYVQLDFHIENGVPRGKIKDDPPEHGPYDPGKTKFGYSTVVFEQETKPGDDEGTSRTRPKKMPPIPPAKYEGKIPKHSSDSNILYSDVQFGNGSSAAPQAKKRGSTSLTEIVSDEDSPYVNVRHGGAPVVPPRRGIASPIVEQSPPVPTRKTN